MLVPVMLIGLTGALLMGAFINYSVFIEQAAIENNLAETRAYWAIVGHVRYANSRQRHSALCPDSAGCAANQNIKDTDKITALQSYLDEISTYRTFTYPEENSSYSIKIDLAASVDADPTRNPYSGYLTIAGSYPTTGVSTLPVLSGMAQRFAPLQVRMCTSLVSAFAGCGGVANNNNGGHPTGYYSVRRLFRTQSAS
jgi:hypothetical protein